MAWETSGWQTSSSGAADSILVQESQRAFMSRVHGWMFVGLLVTGATALLTVSNAALLNAVLEWRLAFIVAQLGAVFALSFMAPRLSGPAAAVLFLGYSALTGMTLSVLLLIFTAGSLAQAFFLTAAVYGAMAIYGTVTKKNLGAWGTFLFMGLVGVVLGMRELRRIARGEGAERGRTLARVTVVLGWVDLGLAAGWAAFVLEAAWSSR